MVDWTAETAASLHLLPVPTASNCVGFAAVSEGDRPWDLCLVVDATLSAIFCTEGDNNSLRVLSGGIHDRPTYKNYRHPMIEPEL